MEKILKRADLEDVTSPKQAQYTICLKQLAEGYSVETSWGGKYAGSIHCERYYRENFVSAHKKFEQILALKTMGCRRNRRLYKEKLNRNEQLLLDYLTTAD